MPSQPLPSEPEPDTVSEEAAKPQQVDWPEQETVKELPAERTTAPDIEDTGYIWDETLPGETQGMPSADRPRLLATRVTQVSDTILFGAAILGVDEPVFQLIPAHRDRLRVNLQIQLVGGQPIVYLGHDRNISETQSSWRLAVSGHLLLMTRAAIYCRTIGGSGTVRIQWATELVAESPNV